MVSGPLECYISFYKQWLISESIYTQGTLEKDLGQPRWPNPEAEKRGVWTGSTLFYWKYQEKMGMKMGMILLMTGYHKEPIAMVQL